MKLSEEAISNIRKVKNTYERQERLADLRYFKEILEIVESEEKCKGVLTYSFLDAKKTKEHAYVSKGKLCICYKHLMRICSKYAQNWIKSDQEYHKSDYTNLINFFVNVSLLHEGSHVWQQNYLEEEEEINKLWHAIMTRCSKMSDEEYKRMSSFLTRYQKDTYYERQANVDSYREVAKIYTHSSYRKIAEWSHLDSLDYPKNGTAPVIYTKNKYGIRENFDFSGISMEKRIEIGAPLPRKTFEAFDNLLILAARDAITYDQTLEKIKKLK